MPPPFHAINKHGHWDIQCVLSVLRGFRNGVITGVRVRAPYMVQAIVYALLFREGGLRDKMKFVFKQMCFHARNLALFVALYKSICCFLRNMGVSNGIESLLGGFLGGFSAFGESKGISGSVNNQLVLYLFARSFQALLQSGVNRGLLPSLASVQSPLGFRLFAGVTLALTLYFTEHEPDTLTSSFMSTMHFLYHKSDHGPMVGKGDKRFLPILFLVGISLLGYVGYETLSLDSLLTILLG